MPQSPTQAIENNFTSGLKTEYTGLNFPPHAATDTDNCVYTLVGDVIRRFGFDYESNYTLNAIPSASKAMSTYKWNNAGGDGTTQIVVSQVGNILYLYRSSSATVASPLSAQKLVSTVDISTYLVAGSSKDPSIIECQYSDGNGYLFVYHPYIEPIYCTYTAGTITARIIALQVRDFSGIGESGVDDQNRPAAMSAEHNYNLQNQGWTSGNAWYSTSSNPSGYGLGPQTFTITPGLTITNGTRVKITVHGAEQAGPTSPGTMAGSVTNYTGSVLSVNIDSSSVYFYPGSYLTYVELAPTNIGFINTWLAAIGLYPSNADVWWYFKDSTNAFSPGTTFVNTTLSSGPAPKGHFILNPFNQLKSTISSVASLTDVTTQIRPKTGTWFQGRVWYAGADDTQSMTGDADTYSWTENIYFSQIVTSKNQLGKCFQVNDPTSSELFSLLPTDGGVIRIQGCGSVYKLFPIQNGLLVFAANGIWFITGSQGIGFTANDYTVTKISSIQSISSTSFVNVQGLPYFWNEEGVYTVAPAQQGLGLTVQSLTFDTIATFYESIPVKSKLYARGDYDPINYVLTWVYKSTLETDVTSRYNFDKCLNLNVYSKAFYPYTIAGAANVHGINYISNPATVSAPDPIFKYLVSSGNNITFSEERNRNYLDFISADSVGKDYASYFVTGYALAGQAIRRFQPLYVYMYSRTDEDPTAYTIQGIWNYASSGNSGRWTSTQESILHEDQYSKMAVRRHKIRGQGLSLQLKITSVSGYPFDIMGWNIPITANVNV